MQMPNDWATASLAVRVMVSTMQYIQYKKKQTKKMHSEWIRIRLIGNRKSTDESSASPAIKRRRGADDDSDISFSYSNISCNSTLNSSNQWEVRILKADLIEANTKVKHNFAI